MNREKRRKLIKTRILCSFSDLFRDVLKQQKYEKYVLRIISESKVLLADREFVRVEDQHAGDPDYIDKDGNKYDVKLLIDSKQGALLGERKNHVFEWFTSLQDECAEYAHIIEERDSPDYDYDKLIDSSRLYRILRDRFDSISPDETPLFFIPYPIVQDYQGSKFLQFTTDFLQAVINRLKVDRMIDREMYFIYPSMNAGVYVLRNTSLQREYISISDLSSIIEYMVVE